MNPSTALATVLVDELVRHGVRHAVLCPGSRSAPLAYALQQADRAGHLTLHVRVDERSAGFLALGLAKLTRVPAVVVTTSGTAVANLHPAVLEAHHGIVPLIVLSADRPPELRGTGANQTTVQPGMFGGALRWSHELGTPERRDGQQAGWRSVVSRAVAAARGVSGDAGPVHVNVPLREPLVPTDDGPWPESLQGRPGGLPWTQVYAARTGSRGVREARAGDPATPAPDLASARRTLVVIGDLPTPDLFDQAVAWAAAHRWPVIAEPFAGHPRPEVIPHGPLLLSVLPWLEANAPERVITVGRVTLSRDVASVVRRKGVRVETVSATTTWSDPSSVVAAAHRSDVLSDLPERPQEPDDGWLSSWCEAGKVLAKAVAGEPSPWPSGPAVAAVVLGALPSAAALFVGSSNAARDLDLAATSTAPDVTVVASRGLAGIDGCVSTAAGLALAGPRAAYALMGDLTFLHDANGLLVGPHEPVPDLTIVVTNDDGGGIFTLLEPGEPERAGDFERIFGTPTGTDLGALCQAHGVAHRVARTRDELYAVVGARPQGLLVVEVPVERAVHRAVHARLREVAHSALAQSSPDAGLPTPRREEP
ncbi:2-succinyl-5-enolpyruvyl-6-hydroxy-3-cyclohexene-1-carboxylic-acid synthase [Nostocoides sp. HKS02]|uniref:2-succinyl-5-enolpyruvyl-6-hydroxy-3- cyclohexene-1-carboxylic-acid synthase n=1 Tax=Nostocoides sp. HKS02 TaxID=1813880 RepID=UPI0012B4CB19|nr:2-succinyl-5-enolpyruvyl-6-hydroxy-3-cyclohexene-1-carboxylic-acid synthase [Tetrasphaera sp. HKS02]QGN58309.1 2-succinyl-5-enolpyruvyl-6-hydroxy-3-cyclohexene-1-carboxylic-acid synthase [Tetrasphaera sp. HKS02]